VVEFLFAVVEEDTGDKGVKLGKIMVSLKTIPQKVEGLVYDRSGDFDGFVFCGEDGSE